MKKKMLFILGMHRSGTSALTRVLNLGGIELGKNLMESQKDVNEKGFWEDKEGVELNDEILSFQKSIWYGVNDLDIESMDSLFKKKIKSKIKKFLKKKFKETDVFGFKDPRTCRTLPLWQEVLEEMGVEGSYLLISRNPLEVAASLERRDLLVARL